MVQKTHINCNQEQKIDGMVDRIENLEKVVVRNGHDSLLSMATQTRNYQKQQHKDLDALKTNVSALMTFQIQSEAQDDVKKMMRQNRRWLIGVVATMLCAFGGTLLIIVFG